MDNYSYPPSYPDSGNSSPRSREIEFENPPPWEDSQNPQLQQTYKVKFMCSYGGKINPRPHDNQLSYTGGETKILAVDRSIKFSSLVSKLSALCDYDNVLFKYQLPGEDLDSLISVSNDDDLEHMMHEYDRLYRASPRPARLRLFLFPMNTPPPPAPTVVDARSFGSNEVIKSEKERFVEDLNSGHIQTSTPASAVAPPPPPPPAAVGNMDFLFGLEKEMAPPPLQPQQTPVVTGKLRDPFTDPPVHEHDISIPGLDDRMMASDPIQKHIQDLQRLRLEEQQGMYRRKSEDNHAGGYPIGASGDYYVQKVPEKASPVTFPSTVAVPATGYWQEKHVAGGVFPTSTLGSDQPVYMMPAPAGAYHAPMMRPLTAPTGQGYYRLQRVPEIYREQQVYNVVPTMPAAVSPPPSLPTQGQPKAVAYSEGYGMMRQGTTGGVGMGESGYPQQQVTYDQGVGMMRQGTTGGVGMVESGYPQQQVTYDQGVGRQVYYTAAQGGVMAAPPPQPQQQAQYQAMAAALSGVDVTAINQDTAKLVAKATQAPV